MHSFGITVVGPRDPETFCQALEDKLRTHGASEAFIPRIGRPTAEDVTDARDAFGLTSTLEGVVDAPYSADWTPFFAALMAFVRERPKDILQLEVGAAPYFVWDAGELLLPRDERDLFEPLLAAADFDRVRWLTNDELCEKHELRSAEGSASTE